MTALALLNRTSIKPLIYPWPKHLATMASISNNSSGVRINIRKSEDRGHADHDWLKTYHTFSFASYDNPNFEQFGPLRVINEDRVKPTEGFGTHSHREFEIWSYVISGELEHRDSLGGLEILKRGDVQMTSTGRGIQHSEFNRNKNEQVHFLQMWAKPNKSRLDPKYYARHFSDEEKIDKFVKTVAPVESSDVVDERDAKGPAPIHSDLTFFATIIKPYSIVAKPFETKTNKAYVHLIMSKYRQPGQSPPSTSAKINVTIGDEQLSLVEGDGAFIEFDNKDSKEIKVENVGESHGELVLFEMS